MQNSKGKQNGTWSIDHTPPDGPRTHTHTHGPILHRHATGRMCILEGRESCDEAEGIHLAK